MDKYIPYVKSNKFPHLSKEQRASQFAPFSVLEGLDEAINKIQEQEKRKFEVQRVNEVEIEINKNVNGDV